MTLSKFRSCPIIGHTDRIKRVYGYLLKMRNGQLRFRTELPEYSDIPIKRFSWEKKIYGNVEEIIPNDCPKPLGKGVIMTTYVDANLCHDMTTGRAVTGVLHFLNKTLIDYFSKRKPTLDTDTYGSEFLSERTSTEQVMEIRTSLRYLGVPLIGPTFMFGDNQTVVNGCIDITSHIYKRHILLSYHRVRESITSNIIVFNHIPGSSNPVDIKSKSWGYQQVWKMIKTILFWEGDTLLIY